jgi:Chitinase class I
VGTGGQSGGDGDEVGSGGSSQGGGCVLDGLLGEVGFNSWFQARRDPFYTYANLCEALKLFPGFANTGNAELDKRELAAFFANVSRETGELDYIEQFPESRGSTGNYYGRGPLQLTWDYNYRAAGDFLGVDLVQNPSLLHTDGVMTWKASLWFWMHSDGAAKGTCHGAIAQGRGFGQTINVINGGLECPSSGNAAALQRVAYFENYCGKLGVSPGSGLHC